MVTVAYVHGSTELQEHAKAAKAVTEARQNLYAADMRFLLGDYDVAGVAAVNGAKQDLENAEILLAAAYKLYTNPFSVQKTV